MKHPRIPGETGATYHTGEWALGNFIWSSLVPLQKRWHLHRNMGYNLMRGVQSPFNFLSLGEHRGPVWCSVPTIWVLNKYLFWWCCWHSFFIFLSLKWSAQRPAWLIIHFLLLQLWPASSSVPSIPMWMLLQPLTLYPAVKSAMSPENNSILKGFSSGKRKHHISSPYLLLPMFFLSWQASHG